MISLILYLYVKALHMPNIDSNIDSNWKNEFLHSYQFSFLTDINLGEF